MTYLTTLLAYIDESLKENCSAAQIERDVIHVNKCNLYVTLDDADFMLQKYSPDFKYPKKKEIIRNNKIREKMIVNFIREQTDDKKKANDFLAKLDREYKQKGYSLIADKEMLKEVYTPANEERLFKLMTFGKDPKENKARQAAALFESYLRMFDFYDHPEKIENILNPNQSDEELAANYTKIMRILEPAGWGSEQLKEIFNVLKENDPDHKYVKEFEEHIFSMKIRTDQMCNLRKSFLSRAELILNPLYDYLGHTEEQVSPSVQKVNKYKKCLYDDTVQNSRTYKRINESMQTAVEEHDHKYTEQARKIPGNGAHTFWFDASHAISQHSDTFEPAIQKKREELQNNAAAVAKKLKEEDMLAILNRHDKKVRHAGSLFRNSGYWTRFRSYVDIAAELAKAADRTIKAQDAGEQHPGFPVMNLTKETREFVIACARNRKKMIGSLEPDSSVTPEDLCKLLTLSIENASEAAKEYRTYKLGKEYRTGLNADGKKLNSDDYGKLAAAELFIKKEERMLSPDPEPKMIPDELNAAVIGL